MRVLRFYFSRRIGSLVTGEPVIPFKLAERPTIDVRIGDKTYPMLFNTGTNCCIFWSSSVHDVPAVVEHSVFTWDLAYLESKSTKPGHGQELSYGTVPVIAIGEARFRDVPFRLYTGGDQGSRDFAGAVTPLLFMDYIVEVNNSENLIKLHDPDGWVPPAGLAVLPVLLLPRGMFIPLWLEYDGMDGREPAMFWFHMDTGFSGGVGVLPSVLDGYPGLVRESSGTGQVFQGWHGQFEYEPVIIRQLAVRPYSALTWASGEDIRFKNVDALRYRDAYRELDGYRIGGIIGGGFLAQFDYFIDYRLNRLYLMPREL